MNHIISLWTPAAIPANWASTRDQWLRNHTVRTVAGSLGFVGAAFGIATQSTPK